MDTDLLKQLSQNPPVLGTPAVIPAPEPVAVPPAGGESAEPPVTPEPPPVPEPAPLPEPSPVGEPEPTPAPEPAPVPEPTEPQVAPEPPVPTQPTAAVAVNPAALVRVMQESVKGGQIKEFNFDQVTEWKAGEPETIDGEAFQTGTAKYKAVTFLGEKLIEAKAYINKDGKVLRWIWPRSGMEIK